MVQKNLNFAVKYIWSLSKGQEEINAGIPVSVLGYRSSDPEHITAILGQTVHFNCHANFPNEEVVPYVVQWEKRGSDTPIFIW